MGAGHAPTVSRGVDWWRFLPNYWVQNAPTDRTWDFMLNRLLDLYEVKQSYLTAQVGPIEVWVGNWPYAYGNSKNPDRSEYLPMVRTRRRLRKLLAAQRYGAAEAAIAKATGA